MKLRVSMDDDSLCGKTDAIIYNQKKSMLRTAGEKRVLVAP